MVHQVHQAADVTPFLLEAWNQHHNWSRPILVSLLERLQLRLKGSQIDWEPGVEDWATVLVHGQGVGFVCSRMPLAIIESGILDHVCHDLPDEVMVLSVPSLDTPVLAIDRKTTEIVFDRELSDNVDWSALSANDFWWATV